MKYDRNPMRINFKINGNVREKYIYLILYDIIGLFLRGITLWILSAKKK
jgi:hypothetical protein